MVSVQTLQDAAADLKVDWRHSALQMGVFDGRAGRAPIDSPPGGAKAAKAWLDLYERAYEWARRIA